MAERYTPYEVASFEGVQEELRRIRVALDSLIEGRWDVMHVQPEKPREGQTVYADGTDWNPGSGAGVYTYNGSTWGKL